MESMGSDEDQSHEDIHRNNETFLTGSRLQEGGHRSEGK
jgi:hypothetical protein